MSAQNGLGALMSKVNKLQSCVKLPLPQQLKQVSFKSAAQEAINLFTFRLSCTLLAGCHSMHQQCWLGDNPR